MGEYVLDRFNGARWVTMAVSSEPIGPHTFSEHQTYPFDPKQPPFAGLPGYKCRVRFVDETTDMELEEYAWDKVHLNPNDENSELVWGWKCIKRATYPSNSPVQHMKVGVSW